MSHELSHKLSPRQVQILAKIAAGRTNSCIAEELGMGLGTVQTQIRRAMDETGVRTREQLWKAAFREEDRKGRYRYRIPEIDMDGAP